MDIRHVNKDSLNISLSDLPNESTSYSRQGWDSRVSLLLHFADKLGLSWVAEGKGNTYDIAIDLDWED
jgi:hypothetical protein